MRQMKKIKIGNRFVGDGEPCFIIAEAGVNHNGDIELAKKLVEEAKRSGADAVKFQTWITDEILIKNVEKPNYQKKTTDAEESQYDMIKKLELSFEETEEIAKYAKELGIVFISTPEGKSCIDLLSELGVPAFKVGSPDMDNFPLLDYLATKRKPIILSTGMSTLEEVKESVEFLKAKECHQVVLLHCTTNYPTSLEDVNLREMLTLKREFGLPVGYSDHTDGIGVSIAAAYLGAVIIEKHFTLDKSLPGPDHKASLEPEELKRLIEGIRMAGTNAIDENKLKEKLGEVSNRIRIEQNVIDSVEEILGSSVKAPTKSEKEMIKLMRKYIVANKCIKRGERIKEDMLAIKRCGGGLPSKFLHKILGMTAKRDIATDEPLTFEKLSVV